MKCIHRWSIACFCGARGILISAVFRSTLSGGAYRAVNFCLVFGVFISVPLYAQPAVDHKISRSKLEGKYVSISTEKTQLTTNYEATHHPGLRQRRSLVVHGDVTTVDELPPFTCRDGCFCRAHFCLVAMGMPVRQLQAENHRGVSAIGGSR